MIAFSIDELLKYVKETNPQMTKELLISKLKECGYSAKSLIYTAENSGKITSEKI